MKRSVGVAKMPHGTSTCTCQGHGCDGVGHRCSAQRLPALTAGDMRYMSSVAAADTEEGYDHAVTSIKTVFRGVDALMLQRAVEMAQRVNPGPRWPHEQQAVAMRNLAPHFNSLVAAATGSQLVAPTTAERQMLKCEPFTAQLTEHLRNLALELQDALIPPPSRRRGGAILEERRRAHGRSLVFCVANASAMVKFVGPELTRRKPIERQRPFVDCMRRETKFYNTLALQLEAEGGPPQGFRKGEQLAKLFPSCSLSLVAGDPDDVRHAAFCTVMQDLRLAGYTQQQESGGMTEATVGVVLAALASLHAIHWQDSQVLTGEQAGVWTLARRSRQAETPDYQPSLELEPDAAQERWAEAMATLYRSECGEQPERDLPAFLGRNLASVAARLDATVAKTAITLIHGSAQPRNIWTHSEGTIKLADMSWSGRGNPMSDVAYLFVTALTLPPDDMAAEALVSTAQQALYPASVWWAVIHGLYERAYWAPADTS